MDDVDSALARLGAILVDDGALRRMIKADLGLRGAGLRVPHDHSHVTMRDGKRVLVVTGDRGKLATAEPEAMTRLWRNLFHAKIHAVIEEAVGRGALTEAGIRERVDEIGQTEFDEIRSVLRQEHLLVPPADERVIYAEFVALYLELQQFQPRALEHTFPAIGDFAGVDATIRRDVDAQALLLETRPPGAPERPVIVEVEEVATPSRLEFADRSARKQADKARKKGNLARAAMMAARAGDLPSARSDLEALVERLGTALGTTATSASDLKKWADALLPVAVTAGTQESLRIDVSARLLFDLQAACLVAEREVKVVDLVGWALSLGKQTVVRALPATREVRIAKNLHAASDKVSECELEHAEDRERLAEVINEIVKRGDTNVRDQLRPKVEAALHEVGLLPHSLPERVAEKKLVDELLDRAVEVGRLTLGDLRDAISKNDLKIPDLSVDAIKHGDQLLQADKKLARSLDGVYRSGEIYLRFLQKLSSVVFGTWVGRIVTLYAVLPFLGAFATLEGLQHIVGPLAHLIFGVHPEIATPTAVLAGTAFLFLVLHLVPFRQGAWWSARMLWRGLVFGLWTLPGLAWSHPTVRAYLTSRFHRWLVRPAILGAIFLPFFHGWLRWVVAGGAFAVFALLPNSRLGRKVEEKLADAAVDSGKHVAALIPALIKWIMEFFGKLVDLVDRGIYRVDELLRFRQGQSMLKLAVKGVLGVFWFVIAYVLRLSVDLFIEPTTNPIKHFPVVTVAAKLMIPFISPIGAAVTSGTTGFLGPALAKGLAGFTVLMLPGFAGFLVWELKENWKLYRASRPPTLGALAIGHHGESMIGFLKPGFHSGTIPKLFTKLRRAAWRGDERGIAKQHAGLHHVEEAIAKFVDRQLVSMLVEVEAFHAKDVALSRIDIGSNRVQITLVCPSLGSVPSTVRFELQSGWIVAGLAEPGWTQRLDPEQRKIFEIALAGFYKLSGVDLLREQLEQALKPDDGPVPPYDIADEGLVVWPGDGFATEAVYDLQSNRLVPTVRGARYTGPLFDLGGRHALFGREPLYWSVWSTTWQQIARGETPMPIIVGPSLLGAAPATKA